MIDAPSLDPVAVRSLPTPCLVADLRTVDANIAAAAVLQDAGRARLRPHFKAHKCSELLARQVGPPSEAAVTCATAYEAEVLAAHGFGDVLVANEVCDPVGLAALGRAAAATRVTVAVDHLTHVAALARLAADEGVELAVLVEVDVGMHRCGVAPDAPALLELATAISEAPGLALRGLQCYEGHAVLVPDRDARRTEAERSMAMAAAARQRLVSAGLACPLLSGGGTGTLEFAAELDVLDEIQVGSYVLMDATYDLLGLPFAPALFIAATVLSRPDPESLVVNAGLKATTLEYGLPRSTIPGAQVSRLADEHAVIDVAPECALAPGDLAWLVPAHVDPTMNLHPELRCWDDAAGRLERWEVDGRRRGGRDPA